MKIFKGVPLQNSNPNSMEIIVKSKAKECSLELKKKLHVSIKEI